MELIIGAGFKIIQRSGQTEPHRAEIIGVSQANPDGQTQPLQAPPFKKTQEFFSSIKLISTHLTVCHFQVKTSECRLLNSNFYLSALYWTIIVPKWNFRYIFNLILYWFLIHVWDYYNWILKNTATGTSMLKGYWSACQQNRNLVRQQMGTG